MGLVFRGHTRVAKSTSRAPIRKELCRARVCVCEDNVLVCWVVQEGSRGRSLIRYLWPRINVRLDVW
jgi:hypothetical protein